MPIPHRLPSERPEGRTRIVKAVEEIAKVLPVAVAQFDHLAPAKYLHGLDQEKIKDLPGLEPALDRFGSLFERLNALIH